MYKKYRDSRNFLVFMISIMLCEFCLNAANHEALFDATQLYKSSMGGIRVVQTINDVKVFFLKSKQLSKEQKQHLNKLRSLGYIQSASTAGFGNEPQIELSGNFRKIKKIVLKVIRVKSEFSLRVKVHTMEEEVLYLKELVWADIENFLVDQKGEIQVASIDYEYNEPVSVNLEFESCDLGITEIRFVFESE